MGRITVTANHTDGVVERPEYSVIIWDSKFNKRITPTSDNELIPTKVKNRPYGGGSYGGTCELVHTGMAFSQYNRMDDDILIGSYVQIKEGKEIIFVGTITNLQIEASAATNMVTYLCRDLWHAISDHSVYIDLNAGISSGGMLGLIAGKGPYIVRRRTNDTVEITTISYESTSAAGTRMPADASNNIIVDISPTMIGTGNASIPRSFRGEDSAQIIERMAEEQEIDMLGIVPSKPDQGILGTVTGYRMGDRERTVVFGAASANDDENLDYMPIIHNIHGTVSYDGVISNIEIRGGAITRGFTDGILPAWNSDLNADALADPSVIDDRPGLYSMVGRVWFVPTTGTVQGILPFTDVPSLRAVTQGLADGSLSPVGNTDSATIWEHVPAKGDIDDNDNWQETGEPYIFTRYNKDMPFTRKLNIDGVSKLDWYLNNYAVVIFAEPQVEKVYSTNGETGKREEAWQFKNMELQATQFLGNLSYSTGHQGKYPRARTRYVDAPQWRKQKPYSGTRYIHSSIGRAEETSKVLFDNSGSMTPEADRAVRNTSKSDTALTLEIDGLDKSWRFGDTITTILDTDGEVVDDQLDWSVRGIDYMLGTQGEAVTTILTLDNETKY